MMFKRKQIVVLSLVLLIVVAGYIQYSYKQSSSSADPDGGRTGEAVYVDNEDLAFEEEEGSSAMADENEEKSVKASKQAEDFFAQSKLEREVSLSRDTETLNQITQDENATEEIKAKAYDQMMQLVEISQKEARLETLIKEKGYEDVLVLFGEDGSVDIVVKAPSLTQADTAQIASVVTRHANVRMDQIHIRPLY